MKTNSKTKSSNKNKSFLSRLFSHNITLLILALIITFTAWFMIKINSGEETPKTIKGINISIELPESLKNDGYAVFGLSSSSSDSDDTQRLTATVDVTGNPIIVANLTASDVKVSAAQTTTITSPGSYTLDLTAKKATLKTDYDFTIDNTSLTPSKVTVYVDKVAEETFPISLNKLTVAKDKNHYDDKKLSHDEVKVSGPETLINQIDMVSVEGNIEGINPGETRTQQQSLVYYDANGEKLDTTYFTADFDTVEVSVTILPVKTVKLKAQLANAPSNHPQITLSPSSLKIAGPQSTLDSITDDSELIETIDFSKLTNEYHELECNITLPKGCKSTENITTVTASVDLSEYEVRYITVLVGSDLDKDKYGTEFTSGNTVTLTVYGPSDKLSELTSSNITVQVVSDSTNLPKTSGGSVSQAERPLKITLPKSAAADCWVYDPPAVDISVTKK